MNEKRHKLISSRQTSSGKKGYGTGFRDEMIATSLVLVVVVGGSFFVVNRLLSSPDQQVPTVVYDEQEKMITRAPSEVLGEVDEVEPALMFEPTMEPTINPTLTPDPFESEIGYGVEGQYGFDEYRLLIQNPRITFDARNSQARKFIADVELENFSVQNGLQNRLSASIIKNGTVIVPTAAMSVNQSKVLLPGEAFEFQARISLIEGTDVSTVQFTPKEPIPTVVHELIPS